MSLRDYFAGQAMIALMGSASWVRGFDDYRSTTKAKEEFKSGVAAHAYLLADAMLAERDKPR
jgi:hypothetical protein